MNLQQQVVSLDIAKELKELGVRQESLFWWAPDFIGRNEVKEWGIRYNDIMNPETTPMAHPDYVSAFTVAELGEMLPESVLSIRPLQNNRWNYKPKDKWLVAKAGDSDYCCLDESFIDTQLYGVSADTEADARGKMLIYLIKNKLITL